MRRTDRDIDILKKAMKEVFKDFPTVEVKSSMKPVGELKPIIRIKKSFLEEASPEETLALLIHEYTHYVLGSELHDDLFERTSQMLQTMVKEKLGISRQDDGKLSIIIRE